MRGSGRRDEDQYKDGADDPTTIVGAAFRFANRQTPIALVALITLGFLFWIFITKIDGMSDELRDHTWESNWYQRQSCVSLSILAGTSAALCTPKGGPENDGR